MKAKLIKTQKGYYLDTGKFDGMHLACYPHDVTKQRLSLKNCQAIERGYDLDELACSEIGIDISVIKHIDDTKNYDNSPTVPIREAGAVGAGLYHMTKGFELGFQKALELMGDKKFTEKDVRKAMQDYSLLDISEDTVIQSLQQTEWDAEIEMEKVIDETKIIGAVKGVKGSGNKITTYKQIPKLDADGCLILRRK